ncbi:hypothetical protein [Priestia aryabhattai]|uniref:Uncharacterized protein n=1 Tax=Priestia aryabhattai TaxID=412384 RepID=A0ABD7WUM6_PRIAR|nr:hypothetical protein [Priestia aryabhattai]WEA43812.1 hypothetical protein PWO00_23755 [Priestia aryabhattai]
MKEIDTIKSKIVELETKKEALTEELAELTKAIEDSFEDLLLGNVEEKTIDKAKAKFEELSAELKKNEEYIQRAKAVRKKLAVEKVIPFAKEKREKRQKEIQERYDKQVKVVHEARNAFLRELANLGQIRNEIGAVNSEYNQLLSDMGEAKTPYGSAIREVVVIPNGFTTDEKATGINELIQKQTYSSGNVPSFTKEGDSK